jgi:hypothetical protein
MDHKIIVTAKYPMAALERNDFDDSHLSDFERKEFEEYMRREQSPDPGAKWTHPEFPFGTNRVGR